MKKTRHDVWIFPLPSGLEIHLRDVPQEDLDFLDSIEQKTARIAELEAVLQECRDVLDEAQNVMIEWSPSMAHDCGTAIAKIDEVLSK